MFKKKSMDLQQIHSRPQPLAVWMRCAAAAVCMPMTTMTACRWQPWLQVLAARITAVAAGSQLGSQSMLGLLPGQDHSWSTGRDLGITHWARGRCGPGKAVLILVGNPVGNTVSCIKTY